MPDESYDALQQRCLRAEAMATSLQRELTDKNSTWSQERGELQSLITLARKLCESILIRNISSGDFLGHVYSFGAIPTRELLIRANTTLSDQYTKSATTAYELAQLLRTAEKKINNLETENAQLRNSLYEREGPASQKPLGVSSAPEASAEQSPDGNTKVGKEIPPKPAAEPPSKPQTKDYFTQQAADEGRVELIVVQEDDDDVTLGDITRETEAMVLKAKATATPPAVKLRPESPTVLPSNTSSGTKASAEKAALGAVNSDDDTIAQVLSTPSVEKIFRAVGETGAFDSKTLAEFAELSNSTFRNRACQLFNVGLIDVTTIPMSFASNYTTYRLTERGRVHYAQRYNKEPAASQLDQVIRDHATLEHGIPILKLAQKLCEQFSYVSMDRSENTFTLQDGSTYVPDIVAKVTSPKKRTLYIEYERGTHTVADFRAKLNKMLLKTSVLTLVTPNTKVAQELNRKVLDWVKIRGGFGSFHNRTIVRITPITKALESDNFIAVQTWTYYYDLSLPANAQRDGLPDVQDTIPKNKEEGK